jgi:2,4-dienoyl-CoA reductase (NADPH2)
MPTWCRWRGHSGRADEINTCIACNQACLDHTFGGKLASCLVNPRACHETVLNYPRTASPKRIAVVGAGPAGLAFSSLAAQRGHAVSLFEQSGEIGGQFNMAKRIPGKEDFHETLRYFAGELERHQVDLKLDHHAGADELAEFDEVVIATGVNPRKPDIPGLEHSKVVGYIDVLQGKVEVGRRVAIVGDGGIGFDVAEFLVQTPGEESASLSIDAFAREWGIDLSMTAQGGVAGVEKEIPAPAREIVMLQRKKSKPGKGLGKTTGWAHRLSLKGRDVKMLAGVEYQRIDDDGLHISIEGQPQVLEVDHVVICAGQVPNRKLVDELTLPGDQCHLIGGAHVAAELDAKLAIREACELAAKI